MKAGLCVIVLLFFLFSLSTYDAQQTPKYIHIKSIKNPSDSSCETGLVYWEAEQPGADPVSGTCPEETLSPLSIEPGYYLDNVDCRPENLPSSGGTYTLTVRWCDLSTQASYDSGAPGERIDVAIPFDGEILTEGEDDTLTQPDGCGGKQCGLILSKEDCGPDEKCVLTFSGFDCVFQGSCCTGGYGQENCGEWGNNCGIDKKCVHDSSDEKCVCRERSECDPPLFEPSKWNDDSYIQENNNCYNYGCDIQTDTWAQPGDAGGVKHRPVTCANIIRAAESDGLVYLGMEDVDVQLCGHKAVAVVARDGHDYHWARQDSDGTWSHKMAKGVATNLDCEGKGVITNPINKICYNTFCGYFCVDKTKVVIE